MNAMISKTLMSLVLGAMFLLVSCSDGGSPTSPSLTSAFSSGGSAGTNNVTMEQISAGADTVTVAIKFNAIAEQLKGADLDLTYDSTVVSISSVDQGELLTGDVAFISTDDGNGSILISNIDSSVSFSQSGTFCTITFKGEKVGSAAVNVLSASSEIFNASGVAITGVTWSGGAVDVM